MTIALILLAILAAADVVVFGILLGVVGWQYRRIRATALSTGHVLPRARGQFFFVGLMLLGGAAIFITSVFGLMSHWSW